MYSTDLSSSGGNFYTKMRSTGCGCDGDVSAPTSPSSGGAPEISTDPESGIISVGDYEIRITKNTVEIWDTESEQWVKAWGDPHLLTSDGDKAQFHTENLTFDLPGGIKVTIVPTEETSPGAPTFVDKVAVMTEDQSVLVDEIHSGGLNFGPVEKSTGDLDDLFEDGTVVYVKDELDDLFFTANDAELVGTDPTARFNEHELDGIGGESRYDFGLDAQSSKDLEMEIDELLGSLGDLAGLDIYSILFILMGKASEGLQEAGNELLELNQKKEFYDKKMDEHQEALAAWKANNPGKDPATTEGAPKFGLEDDPRFSNLDGKMAVVNSKIQRFEQLRSQLNTLLSNLSKSDHEMKMVNLRNIPTR